MQDRIKQLAQEAGMYVDVKGEPWPKWMGAEECEQSYQKFAELIVLKCAEIADTAEPFLASDLIKQHFGVKE
jgi:hypothetical protein